MALINATTPSDKKSLIYCIDDTEARWLSFSAANHVLSGVISNLPANPRLIKTLDVDSAIEAISWVQDPALLESIVASDSRTGVADAARSQMRKVASRSIESTPNQRNIEERTRRLLAKPVETWAANLVDTEVSPQMLANAVEALDDRDFEKFAHGVISSSNLFESIRGFTPRLAAVFVREGSNSPLLSKAVSNSRVCHAVINSWVGDWNDAFANMALRVMERHEDPSLIVSLDRARSADHKIRQDCIDIWVDNDRLDFLSATGRVSDEIIKSLASKRKAVFELVPSINVAARESYVDILAERMVILGALSRDDSRNHWRSSVHVELFLNNELSNVETIRNICAMMESRLLSEILNSGTSASRLKNEDLVFIVGKMGFREAASALLSRSSSEPTEQQLMLLEAVIDMPGSAGLAKNRYRYTTTEWVFSNLALRLTEAFKGNPAAWESFWTVYNQTSEASFNELIALSLTLS